MIRERRKRIFLFLLTFDFFYSLLLLVGEHTYDL
jgi:hypothetical protein